MSTKRQKCPRCNVSRSRSGWAPKAWGKKGKWCRQCRREHRQQKRAAAKKPAPNTQHKTAPKVRSVNGTTHVVKESKTQEVK